MRRPRFVRLAAFAFVLGVALPASAAAQLAGPARGELLPDLDPKQPGKVTAALAPDGSGRVLLSFGSTTFNLGTGPLIVTGRRGSTSEPQMSAEQEILHAEGTTTIVPSIGVLQYVVSEDHSHWHFLGFMNYELRHNGSLVRPDQKTGFCLVDDENFDKSTLMPGEPAQKVFTGSCEKKNADALEVKEGISVGYGDHYKPTLEGQYLDISGLAAGRYVLVHRVNNSRTIRELDYDNNAASVLIELSYARGATVPTVEILRSCPDTGKCKPKKKKKKDKHDDRGRL